MRHKNVQWNLPCAPFETWEQVSVAVLMDIRDELQALNRLLLCDNFLRIPRELAEIRKSVARKRKSKKPRRITK